MGGRQWRRSRSGVLPADDPGCTLNDYLPMAHQVALTGCAVLEPFSTLTVADAFVSFCVHARMSDDDGEEDAPLGTNVKTLE